MDSGFSVSWEKGAGLRCLVEVVGFARDIQGLIWFEKGFKFRVCSNNTTGWHNSNGTRNDSNHDYDNHEDDDDAGSYDPNNHNNTNIHQQQPRRRR